MAAGRESEEYLPTLNLNLDANESTFTHVF
jgi:hypothetical protein